MKLTADEQRVCDLKALDRADAKHTPGLEPFSDAPSLHREVVLLRDINKDLLTACKAALSCMAHTRKECLVLLPSEEWTLERGNYREDCKCEIATVRAAIRKAEGK